MKVFSKIAQGLASWLNFEQRSGRESLFCESYLSHPIGQLLKYRYEGRVKAEVKHPALQMNGVPGKCPTIDFAVTGKEGKYDLVVEVKWISKSPTLMADIIADIIRLDLLLPEHSREAIIIIAGNVRSYRKLFGQKKITELPLNTKYAHFLSIDVEDKADRSALYFRHQLTPQVRALYAPVIKRFQSVEISSVIQLYRNGPFPHRATANEYMVCIWRLSPRGKKFNSADYDNMTVSI